MKNKEIISKNIVEEFDINEPIRLNKLLSDAGVCSRREADRLIEAGKIIVDGVPAVMGQKVLINQVVEFNGKRVSREEEFVFLALNKPVGIECTTDSDNKDNIVDYIGYEKRIYPVGRLDKNSEGLILLTNNGAIVNKILKAVNNHEKEYIVKVDKPVTDEFIKKLSNGVEILDTKTRKCIVSKIDKYTFNIILTQGLNRQIRRMCEAFDYKVVNLKRIRIINIMLGNLKYGEYRKIEKNELKELLELINTKLQHAEEKKTNNNMQN